MNRRDFFKYSGALALNSFIFPQLLHAQTNNSDELFTVLIRCQGGWDVTLGLDPWVQTQRPDESDMFIEYKNSEVINLDNGIFLGPAAAPLKNFQNDFSIINGVFLSTADNGHSASETYMSTGLGNGSIASFPIEMSNYGSTGPFGVFYNKSLVRASRSTNSSNFEEIANLPKSIDPSENLKQIFSNSKLNSSYSKAIQTLISARPITKELIQHINRLSQEFNSIPNEEILLAGFLTGATKHGQLTITETLDTHANHVSNHLNAQKRVWNKVANIFKLFKSTEYKNGISMFDKTLFIVTSEFSRTPALNITKGKDHNPLTNSVLIAGNGFKKGQVIGASKLVTKNESKTGSSYHIGYPINYQTGKTEFQRTTNGEMVFPENVFKTAAKIALPHNKNYSALPENIKLLTKLIN